MTTPDSSPSRQPQIEVAVDNVKPFLIPGDNFVDQPPFNTLYKHLASQLGMPKQILKDPSDPKSIAQLVYRALAIPDWKGLVAVGVGSTPDFRKIFVKWNTSLVRVGNETKTYLESFPLLKEYVNFYLLNMSTRKFSKKGEPLYEMSVETLARYQAFDQKLKFIGLDEEVAGLGYATNSSVTSAVRGLGKGPVNTQFKLYKSIP